jgi:hypothetical protein
MAAHPAGKTPPGGRAHIDSWIAGRIRSRIPIRGPMLTGRLAEDGRPSRRPSKEGRPAVRSTRSSRRRRGTPYPNVTPAKWLPRKEVIQPQLPLRLPCYDFVPVTDPTLGGCLPCGLAHRLQVLPTPMT